MLWKLQIILRGTVVGRDIAQFPSPIGARPVGFEPIDNLLNLIMGPLIYVYKGLSLSLSLCTRGKCYDPCGLLHIFLPETCRGGPFKGGELDDFLIQKCGLERFSVGLKVILGALDGIQDDVL